MLPKTYLTVLVALATLAITSAFHHVMPPNKQVTYQWEALVKAGTNLPTNFASQFMLNGKMHLQTSTNCTLVKITDLSYKLYNGILDNRHEYETHSLPVQIPELEKVFKIVYNEKGLAAGIILNSEEKQFSWNMKKAIATVLQMDMDVLKIKEHPHSRILKEKSIYGEFDVDYTVQQPRDGVIMVNKLHDMKTPDHLYEYFISNVELQECQAGYESLVHTSKKDYMIVEKEGHHVIEKIMATGAIAYQPMQAQSDNQFIFVNQTWTLLETVPIKEQFQVTSEHFEDKLTYNPFMHGEDGSIHDITNGRHMINYEKVMPLVKQMLNEMCEYVQGHHINIEDKDDLKGYAVNRVQRLLHMFTLTKLEELQKELEGNSLKMFYHMLPLVGTKASTLMIKKLIMNKTIPVYLATEILKYYPEHVVAPTMEIVTEMEQLLHLQDPVDMKLRKSIILSFGTLIHKSRLFNERINRGKQTTDKYHYEQPYEKYVMDFVNKLKTSKDYKEQMVYASALINMKLHSLIEHMRPALNGEWHNNDDFRLLAFNIMGTSALVDPSDDLRFEVLWPVFINRNETTTMRLTAFYMLMMSKLSFSRLSNLYEIMLQERDYELYSFMYSYILEMSRTSNPCWQHYKQNMFNLIEMLPPPSHGRSGMKINSYRDHNFAFGSELAEYFVISKNTAMFGFRMTSQRFGLEKADYEMAFKVNGIELKGDLVDIMTDVLKNKNSKRINTKDLHIEVYMLRHDFVKDVYFYNQDNLHELNNLLDLFTKETHTMTEELMRITYNEYYKNLMVNDLGFPVMWDYLQPSVQYMNISVKKEMVNKVMNLHVDVLYKNWMHGRHGLTFYNPIADIWQGINRYQVYDSMWPINFELALNMQQQSAQISWKNNHPMQMNGAGIRTYTKMMVFIKDDHKSNVLRQSSPHCENFVVVGHKPESRHTYVLNKDKSLSLGKKWFIGIYDSDNYIPRSSLMKALEQICKSHSVDTKSLLQHLRVSWAHLVELVTHLPHRGPHGFIMKIMPMTEVTTMDLSLRLHSEPLTDRTHNFYTPKMKLSNRITYAIKNQETNLRTWDINSILDMNAGHTVNTLKMYLTRIVPDQKDYKICVDGMKKYTQSGVSGHLNIAMSQSADGKCVKDDTVIDVTMMGEFSKEQLAGHHKYGACEYVRPYSLPHKHNMHCLVAHNTVRHYVYNVKTTNVPTEFRRMFAHWWDMIKGYYVNHYELEDEPTEKLEEHTMKVEVFYPMSAKMMDINMTTPNVMYKMSGIPTHFWKDMGMCPDSLEYPTSFQMLHQIGWVDHCAVNTDHFRFNKPNNKIFETLPSEWTLYVGNVAENPDKAVYVKQVANKQIAVKVVDNGHTLEITPQGSTSQITLDGKVMSAEEYHHETWAYIHVFTQDTCQPVSIMMLDSGLHIDYDHKEVMIVVPRIEHQLQGRCYG